MKARKYNNQTGCYKIDIYLNGFYVCSTDQSKSCKEAVSKWKARNTHIESIEGKVIARYDRTT